MDEPSLDLPSHRRYPKAFSRETGSSSPNAASSTKTLFRSFSLQAAIWTFFRRRSIERQNALRSVYRRMISPAVGRLTIRDFFSLSRCLPRYKPLALQRIDSSTQEETRKSPRSSRNYSQRIPLHPSNSFVHDHYFSLHCHRTIRDPWRFPLHWASHPPSHRTPE